MDKVLQILAVFALMVLVIWRSIHGREGRYRRFSFLGRRRPPLPEEVRRRLVDGIFGPDVGRGGLGVPDEVDGYLWDEDHRVVLFYCVDGKLTIFRRMAGGRNRELQELAVPMDCSGMAWDPEEQRIYLQEGGDYFVYGPEG